MPTTKLKQYFPIIRTKEEILKDIHQNPQLDAMFTAWDDDIQTDFLDFCSRARGVKMLYDSFFKEIMNPEYAPERLNELLSLLLNQQIKVLKVLPTDSTRIASESSLLIMDLTVELADGSIGNIEVQKIGYAFPGQRSACYSADLLLRQYKRVRSESKKKNFSFKNVKSVYTIILFETSQQEFHKYPDTYIHRFRQTSDTGLDIDLLQNYIRCEIPPI